MLWYVLQKANADAGQKVVCGGLAALCSCAPIVIKINASDEGLITWIGIVGALKSRPDITTPKTIGIFGFVNLLS